MKYIIIRFFEVFGFFALLILLGISVFLLRNSQIEKPTIKTTEAMNFTKPSTSPSGLLTQAPYPLPQTITPSPNSFTKTPLPYLETLTPTRKLVSATPILPTFIATTMGEISKGLNIVYSETDNISGLSTIWIVDSSFSARKQLRTFINKAGYLPLGSVSTDGQQIAYLVTPQTSNEHDARVKGGSLWIMNIDGTEPRVIAMDVVNHFFWSPDSTALVYSHLVELEKPDHLQIPLRTELYLVSCKTGEKRLLLSDEIAYGIQPLGWSEKGNAFYYLAITIQGESEIWMININSGQKDLRKKLPYPNIQNLRLSPDASKVLFSISINNQMNLVVMPVEGSTETIISNSPVRSDPINQLYAIWSSDGKELLASIPTALNQNELRRVVVDQPQVISKISSSLNDEFFIPFSWSSDKSSSIILKYPTLQTQVYLLNLLNNSFNHLPLSKSTNWVTTYGWTNIR